MKVDDNPRLLVVDDEAAVRELLVEWLSYGGYEVRPVASAADARAAISEDGEPALMLCDIEMPGESGAELLGWMRAEYPDVAVIMVTGIAAARVAVECMRSGASDYLVKPASLSEVLARVQQALDKRRLVLENRRYQGHLERLVEERTREVTRAMVRIRTLNDDLREAYDATLIAMMTALDYRDFETSGHSIRVVEYAEHLAMALGIREPELTDMRRGVMLHDVGKIGIPDAILRKPGPLDAEEWGIMKMHPGLGFEMLRDIPFLSEARKIVVSHQERYDGSGYPDGLAGADIPLGARIFAVADTFDAMTTDRPYRRALSYERVRQEVIDCTGTQFDPFVVEAFLRVPPSDWDEIRSRVARQIDGREGASMPHALFSRVTAAFDGR